MKDERAMTHCMGVLVVSEQHQRRAVLQLPGLRGLLGEPTPASQRVRAAAHVLPRAAPAAITARRDVLLVSVCPDGHGSVVGWKKKRARK